MSNEKTAEKQKNDEAKTEKISNLNKYKGYRIFFWIFIFLTVLSLINMLTVDYVQTQHKIGVGLLSYFLGLIFSVFGSSFGALIMVISETISSLSFIWIILIFVMLSKIKKFKNN